MPLEKNCVTSVTPVAPHAFPRLKDLRSAEEQPKHLLRKVFSFYLKKTVLYKEKLKYTIG